MRFCSFQMQRQPHRNVAVARPNLEGTPPKLNGDPQQVAGKDYRNRWAVGVEGERLASATRSASRYGSASSKKEAAVALHHPLPRVVSQEAAAAAVALHHPPRSSRNSSSPTPPPRKKTKITISPSLKFLKSTILPSAATATATVASKIISTAAVPHPSLRVPPRRNSARPYRTRSIPAAPPPLLQRPPPRCARATMGDQQRRPSP